MFSYQGKKAVVTGAGRGIGRSVALAFAAQGADVVLAARTVEELESAAEEVEGLGRRAWVMLTDMSDLDQAIELIEKAANAMRAIDILVNNAAAVSHIEGGPGPIEQVTFRSLRRHLQSQLPVAILRLREGRGAHEGRGGGAASSTSYP